MVDIAKQHKLMEQMDRLERLPIPEFAAADQADQDQITVLLTTCPLPSHPSPWVVEAVIRSIRRHLPTSRVLILCDGVNGEEPESYTAFKNAAEDLQFELVEFSTHCHQTLMVRMVLDYITTPLVIVGDGDWGFHQRYMNWSGIVKTLLDDSNIIKHIQIRQDSLGVWEFDMDCFGELQNHHGIDLLPTRNFQAPTHIARTDWYRNVASYFKTPQLLERQEMWDALQITGGINEMAAYIPPGPIGRLYHLNGQHVIWPWQVNGIGDL